MTTTPTPVERAARALRKHALATAPSNHCTCGEAEWTPEHEARAAAEALLSDVDEIARVLADWFGPLDGAYTCDCDAERCPVLPCPTAVTVHEAAAAALIEHLTQTGATR